MGVLYTRDQFRGMNMFIDPKTHTHIHIHFDDNYTLRSHQRTSLLCWSLRNANTDLLTNPCLSLSHRNVCWMPHRHSRCLLYFLIVFLQMDHKPLNTTKCRVYLSMSLCCLVCARSYPEGSGVVLICVCIYRYTDSSWKLPHGQCRTRGMITRFPETPTTRTS